MSTPSKIAAQTAAAAATLLEQPHPELQALQEAVKAAEGTLGPSGTRDVVRSLQGTARILREQRLKALLDELARQLAPLGLKIEGRILQRKPRKKAAKPAPDGGGGPRATSAATPADAPARSGERRAQ